MVVWTPENESKLLLAIFQTQKIDKKALLDVCQAEIDPDMNEKALANKIMRMKQAAEKKGGSPLKRLAGASSSPKSASLASAKTKKKGVTGKGNAKEARKRELTLESDGYNADESEVHGTPYKKPKGDDDDELDLFGTPSEYIKQESSNPED